MYLGQDRGDRRRRRASSPRRRTRTRRRCCRRSRCPTPRWSAPRERILLDGDLPEPGRPAVGLPVPHPLLRCRPRRERGRAAGRRPEARRRRGQTLRRRPRGGLPLRRARGRGVRRTDHEDAIPTAGAAGVGRAGAATGWRLRWRRRRGRGRRQGVGGRAAAAGPNDDQRASPATGARRRGPALADRRAAGQLQPATTWTERWRRPARSWRRCSRARSRHRPTGVVGARHRLLHLDGADSPAPADRHLHDQPRGHLGRRRRRSPGRTSQAQWKALNGTNPAFQVVVHAPATRTSLGGARGGRQAGRGHLARTFAEWRSVFSPALPQASTTTDPATFNEGWLNQIPVTAGPFRAEAIDTTAQTVTIVRNPPGGASRDQARPDHLPGGRAGPAPTLWPTTRSTSSRSAPASTCARAQPHPRPRRSARPSSRSTTTSRSTASPVRSCRTRRCGGRSHVASTGRPSPTRWSGRSSRTPGHLGNYLFVQGSANYVDHSRAFRTTRPRPSAALDQLGWTSPGPGQVRTGTGSRCRSGTSRRQATRSASRWCS